MVQRTPLGGFLFWLLLGLAAANGTVFMLVPCLPLFFISRKLFRNIADQMIGFYMTFAVVSKPDASGHAARLVTRPCGVALVSNTNSNSLDSSIGIESSLSLVVYLMLKIQLMIELFSQSVVSHYTTSEKFLVTCDSGDYSNLAQFRFY